VRVPLPNELLEREAREKRKLLVARGLDGVEQRSSEALVPNRGQTEGPLKTRAKRSVGTPLEQFNRERRIPPG
jgi:hypothetical protein